MSRVQTAEPVAQWHAKPSFLRGKSVYKAAEETDGLRVLATQYWPRGVARTSIDEYVRVLAPSRPLLHSYRSGTLPWDDFRARYEAEMSGDSQRAEIHRLAKIARENPVTIMCVCKEPERCHRSLLISLIERFNA